jgi:hypothetical protein
LNQAIAHKQLDKRTERVFVAAMDALVHSPLSVIEQHVDQAFDAGSNAGELMAVMSEGAENSAHSTHDGNEALWYVVLRRQKAGKPTPIHGAPLTEKDLIPPATYTETTTGFGSAPFKYMAPDPRIHTLPKQMWGDPQENAIDARGRDEKRKLGHKGDLSRRMEELLTTASDTVIRWNDPLLDHHIHEALNCGSNVQEIVELMMVVSESVQGAADSNISGRRVYSGLEIQHYGLQALSRVIAERDKAKWITPREYGEGFTKKMY